jgi:antitoxin (DNA-binding transcriptional repressor) of toxin-antitoxin stability system
MGKIAVDTTFLIERVSGGETIIIAKAGKPRVMLTPLPSKKQRSPGRFRGEITLSEQFFDPLPVEEIEAWEGQN